MQYIGSSIDDHDDNSDSFKHYLFRDRKIFWC